MIKVIAKIWNVPLQLNVLKRAINKKINILELEAKAL